MTEGIRVERERDVLHVVFDRPRVLNALDRAAIHAFETASARFHEAGLRAIILRGEGRAFVAGGDLRDFAEIADGAAAGEMIDTMRTALMRLETSSALTIAAIDGACFGGGIEIALACDIRMAGEHASFGFSQGRIGLNQGWGGSRRLVALVGYARAIEWMVTGARLNPHQALTTGLVSHVCHGSCVPAALDMADDTAHAFGNSAAAMKRTLRAARDEPHRADEVEREAFVTLWDAPGRAEVVDDLLSRMKKPSSED